MLIALPGAAGPRRRHADAARHDDHDPRRRPRPGRPGDGRARRPDAARPDRRPDPRRLADRRRELALDLPDQPADRHRRVHLRVRRAAEGRRRSPSESFDFVGMLLLSPGLALFLYGVSSIPEAGTVTSTPRCSTWPRVGLVLIVGVRALRAAPPQHPPADRPAAVQEPEHDHRGDHDDRCSRSRSSAPRLLFPLYFLQVRGETTLDAGLLLAPQGLGAMLTMPIAGVLADKIGPGKIVLTGIVGDHRRHGDVHPDRRRHVVRLPARRAVRHGHGHGRAR